MADYIPYCEPVGPELQKKIDESVKTRQEFIESPKYVIRTTENYLKNMTCMIINTEHRTYSDEPKLKCVTVPASLVYVLLEDFRRFHEE